MWRHRRSSRRVSTQRWRPRSCQDTVLSRTHCLLFDGDCFSPVYHCYCFVVRCKTRLSCCHGVTFLAYAASRRASIQEWWQQWRLCKLSCWMINIKLQNRCKLLKTKATVQDSIFHWLHWVCKPNLKHYYHKMHAPRGQTGRYLW